MAFLAPSYANSRLCTHRIGITAEKRQEFESILGRVAAKQIELLVEERSQARREGNFSHADMIRDRISVFLPDNWQIELTDIPRKKGGGTSWKLVETKQETPILEGPTVLHLAHAALGLAVESSAQANLGRAHTALGLQQRIPQIANSGGNEQLDSIVEQVKDRFQHTNWTDAELAGRKSADAAFWFALAGVTDQFIFKSLADVATRELDRFGARSSCRAKDIYHMMERFSAAGLHDSNHLEEAAKKGLMSKRDIDDCDNNLDFHSDRSLLLIWKFSTKQKKQRAFLQSALNHWQRQKDGKGEDKVDPELKKTADIDIEEAQIQSCDWRGMFKDPSRPLVVDVGCGMGVSLMGLASGNNPISSQILLGKNPISLAWNDCNFVGMDVGALGIGYARGIAARWGIDDRLQFVVDSAESCLRSLVQSYPGPIKLCLIQFPTPYTLKSTTAAGNSQLPTSARDGFMVTEELLQSVHLALSKSNGKLLVQSNCEDVAVFMHDLAIHKVGFEVESTDQSILETMGISYGTPGITPRVPQRMADWIAMGGKRAEGDDWSKAPILHRDSATETEVACALNGTPVHRCVLRAVSDPS